MGPFSVPASSHPSSGLWWVGRCALGHSAPVSGPGLRPGCLVLCFLPPSFPTVPEGLASSLLERQSNLCRLCFSFPKHLLCKFKLTTSSFHLRRRGLPLKCGKKSFIVRTGVAFPFLTEKVYFLTHEQLSGIKCKGIHVDSLRCYFRKMWFGCAF